jgi:hypothetical protein
MSLGTHRGKVGIGSRDHAFAELPGGSVEHGDNRRYDENVYYENVYLDIMNYENSMRT